VDGIFEAASGEEAGFWFESEGYPISRDNIIYDFHAFLIAPGTWWCENHSETWVRYVLEEQKCEWMLANGRACWLGSVGFEEDACSGNGGGDREDWMREWLNVMNDDGYSGFSSWVWLSQDTLSMCSLSTFFA